MKTLAVISEMIDGKMFGEPDDVRTDMSVEKALVPKPNKTEKF